MPWDWKGLKPLQRNLSLPAIVFLPLFAGILKQCSLRRQRTVMPLCYILAGVAGELLK